MRSWCLPRAITQNPRHCRRAAFHCPLRSATVAVRGWKWNGHNYGFPDGRGQEPRQGETSPGTRDRWSSSEILNSATVFGAAESWGVTKASGTDFSTEDDKGSHVPIYPRSKCPACNLRKHLSLQAVRKKALQAGVGGRGALLKSIITHMPCPPPPREGRSSTLASTPP